VRGKCYNFRRKDPLHQGEGRGKISANRLRNPGKISTLSNEGKGGAVGGERRKFIHDSEGAQSGKGDCFLREGKRGKALHFMTGKSGKEERNRKRSIYIR